MNRILRGVVLLVSLAAALAGCGGNRSNGPGIALQALSLKNAEYFAESVEGGVLRLKDGKYEDPGAHVWATLLDRLAYGDVMGDRDVEAVVVLAVNTGGSGVFHQLALVADRGGRPVHIASANLGDRVKINGLAVENGRVVVAMTKHGPSDAMCCPTLAVSQTYEFRGGRLALIKQDPPDTGGTN